jgi:hypothetical protein
MAVGHATLPAWTRWEVAQGPCHPPSTFHPTCSPRPRLLLPRSTAPCLLSDPVTLPSFPYLSPCLWQKCIQLLVQHYENPTPLESPPLCSKWETLPIELPMCCVLVAPQWRPWWLPPGGCLVAASYRVQ